MKVITDNALETKIEVAGNQKITKNKITKNKITKHKITKHKITKHKITKQKHFDAIKTYFKINYIYYITLLICLFILSIKSKSSFIYLCICFIVVSFCGFICHVSSHYFSFAKYYKLGDTIFHKIHITDYLLQRICSVYDFHHDIHHDSSINKSFRNILFEGLNNFYFQSIILLIFKYLLNFLDDKIIIFWGLFYTTVHIINYSIHESSVHVEHHVDNSTNYGIELYDVLMGTKYDWKNIENHNYSAINIIILTIIFYNIM